MPLKIPTITGVITILFLLFIGTETIISSDKKLLVSFLDIGQGDSIFIESPEGVQVLIDGGKGNAVLHELGKHLSYGDRDLDLVVATHPDLDHIGGLLSVFEMYEVKTVLVTENVSDTPQYEALLDALEVEGAEVIYARAGQIFDIGRGERGTTTLQVLFPDRDPTNWESNTASIVLKLSYGTTDVMLTGDAPDEVEAYLVDIFGTTLQSEILKAGHHGSKTSSSEVFLDAVNPQFFVVSAGRNNSYGHPHKEIMLRVSKRGIQVETTQDGTVTFISDGETILVE